MSQARQRMTTFSAHSMDINTVQDLVLSHENAPQTHRTTRQIERSSRCCQIFGVCQGTSSYSSRTAHLHAHRHGTPSSCYDMKPQTSLNHVWPANSPDLNPVDYRIWALIQERFYQTAIQDTDDLKQCLTCDEAKRRWKSNWTVAAKAESLHTRKGTTLWTAAKLNIAFSCLTIRFRIFVQWQLLVAFRNKSYSLRYSCISGFTDFQVSADSTKLVLGSGDICLHCFMKNYLRSNLPNLFKIRRVLRKLWQNTFWCFFYAPQCTSHWSLAVTCTVTLSLNIPRHHLWVMCPLSGTRHWIPVQLSSNINGTMIPEGWIGINNNSPSSNYK